MCYFQKLKAPCQKRMGMKRVENIGHDQYRYEALSILQGQIGVPRGAHSAQIDREWCFIPPEFKGVNKAKSTWCSLPPTKMNMVLFLLFPLFIVTGHSALYLYIKRKMHIKDMVLTLSQKMDMVSFTSRIQRCVISESEFQRDLEDLLDCLKNQNVIAVKRIAIKRNGQIFPTKQLILTFNNPTLPKSVKIAYINCPVKPYIPDPIRCFKCQKFGHTITACRSNKENCARCSLPDHNGQTCKSTTPKCFNCSGEHPSFCRSCPRYKLEKEIQTIKITKKISFQEARQIVMDRTPKPGLSYSSALNSSDTPPLTSKTPQLQTTAVINRSASHAIVNPTVDNDAVTIKNDWLALLTIKKIMGEKVLIPLPYLRLLQIQLQH
ncbi:hypothetical protein AVEN_93223-1 [Araneus ventricosus]|uniref:CCHC-type domain-containing protein n=1 Tax=Araneus ventricosus TaxID=182803 RepID=A0A4Y2V3P5_ARAVE|nr:hypothetical protein AVEN_93223-1 [Araneus ventricosus]